MFRTDLFKGKRILITGGGTGLGKAMARRFMELGAELHICGRREGVLQEAAKELADATGGKIYTYPCDIRVAQAVDDMIGTIWQQHGPLDGLVNNAAGNFISRTEDLSPRGFDAIANIVLHGSFYVTQAVGKRWIAEQRGGSIISIVTTWVWTGSAFVVPSAMSKAGIAAMTQSLAVEWGPKGIRVNAIAPGPFPTEGMTKRLAPTEALEKRMISAIPMRRVGNMPELANLAAFLMSDEVGYITGEVIAIDGGQWLNGAGGFGALTDLSDAEWQEIRAAIAATNAKDKAQRTV
ncbi:SDR family oxidoreductase [uncultured Ferrovibrio sp.]|jgi:NAD(P)-dependent dehydrogenase (short-subunit alcohol dehydrogenase family)|uniref:SDR family oxidoreductase n=1 Tax=uncultured Ferrovibrio sp. TaxID=1576913 RepID=UPI00261B1C2B|nr:SDR family oxidoreductase [uncultured Ferrovibrio sp.]